ncbi:hypothetical protein BDF14DRAFT_247770 [Spinellus fusiger]|nr:hypothetical protein BDF14DRAFT_247770 [Spinellus fusiger]
MQRACPLSCASPAPCDHSSTSFSSYSNTNSPSSSLQPPSSSGDRVSKEEHELLLLVKSACEILGITYQHDGRSRLGCVLTLRNFSVEKNRGAWLYSMLRDGPMNPSISTPTLFHAYSQEGYSSDPWTHGQSNSSLVDKSKATTAVMAAKPWPISRVPVVRSLCRSLPFRHLLCIQKILPPIKKGLLCFPLKSFLCLPMRTNIKGQQEQETRQEHSIEWWPFDSPRPVDLQKCLSWRVGGLVVCSHQASIIRRQGLRLQTFPFIIMHASWQVTWHSFYHFIFILPIAVHSTSFRLSFSLVEQ